MSRVNAGSPDREAAEWVLGLQGVVAIREGDREREVCRMEDLPPGDFQLVRAEVDNLNSRDGRKPLSRAFAHLENLRELALRQCLGVETYSPTPFVGAELQRLRTVKSLQSLDLTGTRVSDNVVADLQAALPDCKILRGN